MTVQGLRPVVLGLIAGAGGALYLGRFLAHLLWGVSATDPVTIAAVGLVLVTAAGLASWLPARGATRADPVRALRAE
jgi:ABC-type antimicrobial peptide transport system permease subunit